MYDWVLGARPRKWMEMQPNFYLKYSPNIRDFHTHIPDYALTGRGLKVKRQLIIHVDTWQWTMPVER